MERKEKGNTEDWSKRRDRERYRTNSSQYRSFAGSNSDPAKEKSGKCKSEMEHEQMKRKRGDDLPAATVDCNGRKAGGTAKICGHMQR